MSASLVGSEMCIRDSQSWECGMASASHADASDLGFLWSGWDPVSLRTLGSRGACCMLLGKREWGW
eukprot:1668695-Alexandrium_andersonii.AAC.1